MSRVTFHVNGELQSVGSEITSDWTLLDYLRENSRLHGTKYMCREGGCGACIVTAGRPGEEPYAVNSCLVSVTSCQDWEITTVEAVGNRLKGYHPLQKTLAKQNGTQCGYCTPGWIMSMYSLLQRKRKPTMMDVEQSLGSNICRCTGYRPILDAFKKFASDAPKPQLLDIEDLTICNKNGEVCRKSKCSESEWCMVEEKDVKEPQNIEIELKDGKFWSKVHTISDIFKVLKKKGDDSYMFVAGNTAKGAYPIEEYPQVLIDISDVKELKGYKLDQNLMLAAGSSLTETMDIFQELSSSEDEFWYLEKLRKHLNLVAHIPVRNLGTLAGNLMTKHKHNDFPSDIFLLLETVGAYIVVLDSAGSSTHHTPEAFLKVDMKRKIITNILLPPLSHEYKFVSFKIMPRAQNAHAIVNAGFLYKLKSNDSPVTESRIVFGGLSKKFIHAKETEKFLVGKHLFTNETLQGAVKVLEKELIVEKNPPEPSVKYRKELAINLFYKGLLSLCPSKKLGSRYTSGGVTLSSTRPVTKGRQVYSTKPELYPLTEPIEKVEALIQCAGEAPYSEDQPALAREVFGAFAIAHVPRGELVRIEAAEALRQPGVLAFYSARDIPGVNSFTLGDTLLCIKEEELFCSGPVRYYGQVIGVVVAETRHIAEKAAKLIHAKYRNVEDPVIDVKIAKRDPSRTEVEKEIPCDINKIGLLTFIKGEETIYSQYFFCMETLVCVAKPTEEGMEVHTSTQHMDGIQVVISRVLKMEENKIDVIVRRLGGAYGEKITRSGQVAAACALVTQKLNRPCRIALPLTTHTKAVGKRLPCSINYEMAVDILGKVQYCIERLYMDNGYVLSEPLFIPTLDTYYNCYDRLRFNYKVHSVFTDTASNTWCRSPGTLEAISMAELMIERISYEMSLDPLHVRIINLDAISAVPLLEMIEKVKIEGNYAERRKAVDEYNATHRWKKRGLRFSLLRWSAFGTQYLDINMSVYRDDGTVAITHSGIEMGQGINTKTAQIAAHFLGIPVKKIQIKANNTINSPNSSLSGNSVTTLNVGWGVQKCCEQLLLRLAPIKALLIGHPWESVVKAAYLAGIDLQEHSFVSMAEVEKMPVYGVTLAETEIDVLTGEWEVTRVDLHHDAGLSISPAVDVGQVEGAFIMGLGYWTTEQLVYDPKTGELLTDRTWNYHVPQARDIPQDFRVYFKENSYSEPRFLGAKAIGEPSICMSIAIPLAMREAIVSARVESGLSSKEWFTIEGPYTREAIQQATATRHSDFRFH